MKKINMICYAIFFIIMFSGCNYLEDSNSKVLRVCDAFDEGLRVDNSLLADVTTEDFTFSYNPGFSDIYPFNNLEKTTYTFTEFIELLQTEFADFIDVFEPAVFSNINALFKTTTIVDMESICTYPYFFMDTTLPLMFEVTLNDMGGFFKSDWKVQKLYLAGIDDN